MVEDLIYDVGSHTGQDVAYYLSRGFRVVAIDANPALIERVRQQFPEMVAAHRLELVHAAIAREAGECDLCLSASDDGSSSIFAGEVTDPAGTIRVPCLPLTSIFQRFGTPFYLKVDIQGADRFCLEALNLSDSPRYLSWEAGPDALECLDIAHKLGYDAFKCIDQTVFREIAYLSSFRGRILRRWRRRTGIETDRGIRRLGWTFTPGHSSGPFGEDTDGAWRPFEQMQREWLKFQNRFRTLSRPPAWYDFHARHS